MLRNLIDDIAHDRGTLTQALNRTKVIAFNINNKTLQDWVKKELDGYSHQDPLLPSYRKVRCVVKATLSDSFGRQETIPLSFSQLGKEFEDLMTFHELIQSISLIEENYTQLTSETGFLEFTSEQTKQLEETFQIKERYRKYLMKAGREIEKLQLKGVTNSVKQKLLDTLLELNKEFPELETKSTMTEDNEKKIQNIITTNIYGSQSPVSIAAGHNASISDSSKIFTQDDHSTLEKLGVDKSQIEEIKTIIKTDGGNKDSFKGKALKWLGTVSASVAAKGLTENIPAITEFISKHI